MNELKTFNHKMFGELQIVIVDGKEHFSARDVARSLDYKQPHTAVKSHCDPEGVITCNVPTNGGPQNKRFITMGNVSRLIVGAARQSRNPEIAEKAKAYEKWVFDEVIPSIHRTGVYSVPSPNNNTKLLLQTALKHEEEIEGIKSDVNYLKENMRIDTSQEQTIRKRANHVVVEALGGKSSPAYQKISFKAFSAFWKDFKNHFEIPRYGDLPKKKFEEGLRFIGMWQPSTTLRIEIEEANKQQTLKGVM